MLVSSEAQIPKPNDIGRLVAGVSKSNGGLDQKLHDSPEVGAIEAISAMETMTRMNPIQTAMYV